LPDGAANITANQKQGLVDSGLSQSLGITIDTIAPTVDVVDVSPDPRSTSVNGISINFSEAISGFGISDLSLSRNGINRNLSSASLNSPDARNWLLGNLAALTQSSGQYLLALGAATAGISDVAGNALAVDASDQWFEATPYLEGSDADDNYIVRYKAASDELEIFENACNAGGQECPPSTPTYRLARAGLATLHFLTLGGNDSISIDLAGTNLGIQVDTGGGVGAINLLSGVIGLEQLAGDSIDLSIGPIAVVSSSGVQTIHSLQMDAGAVLDIGTGMFILQPSAGERESAYAALVPLIRSGRNGGSWDGTGIRSSAAAADASRSTGVGLLDDLNNIVISHARVGDTDLDGDVDADDFARIDGGFSQGLTGYQHGDFDYSGQSPDADDYFQIDRSYSDQALIPAVAASATSVRKATPRLHHRKRGKKPGHRRELPALRQPGT